MIHEQLEKRGIKSKLVLDAFSRVPRHLFVPEKYRSLAYADRALPIGKGQTISQPYIVAFMTEALDLKPSDRVLEIGTGTGYQAAILAEICDSVYSIEIIKSLGERAANMLKTMGYANVELKIGDGYQGWIAHAPFDAIIVTCAPTQIPEPLIEQLEIDGVVFASNRSCKVFSVMQMDEERKVKEDFGIPAVMIDVDHADVRKFSQENVYVRLEALLESIEANRTAAV
jgi:protein-L-isoaspartate(D-aspartate) O-methyltransferase